MDEFGHVGPYISRSDTRHNTSPVFGLSGIVLPVDRVRPFASYFYRLKCNLLGCEIQQSGKPAYLVLDEQEESFRASIVAEASREMFGDARRNNMIEPPIQAESHLFQTLQCADWICGLVGRIACYAVAPNDYLELDWTTKYFNHRLADVAPISSIRRENAEARPASRTRGSH